MNDSPLNRRLAADHQKVLNLVSGSGGKLLLLSTSGNPPTFYLLEFHCPSLVKKSGNPEIVDGKFQVEIKLGADYPFHPPQARMLTPVFNPHVFNNNSVCLGGVWSPAETLDTIILKIGALLQLDPRVLDPHSAANQEANSWAIHNRRILPVGHISFISSTDGNSPVQPRIQWS